MKKLLLLPLIFACVSVSAYAVPNVWVEEFGHGDFSYYIYDAQDRLLSINCNSGANIIGDPYAHLEIKGKSYQSTSAKDRLAFLVDNKKSLKPPSSTGWRNADNAADNAWNAFVEGMSKAKRIDVYLNNKKITTFTPPQPNINEVASGIAGCSI